MSTNIVKWDDDANRLTAYCLDDIENTEIGPAKWDDANNKLEVNCDSTDFQVKWNDAGKKLEARSVSEDCCCYEYCTECYHLTSMLNDNSYDDCCIVIDTAYGPGCCWMGINTPYHNCGNVTYWFRLKYTGGNWVLRAQEHGATPRMSCDSDSVLSWDATTISFDCATGGTFEYGSFAPDGNPIEITLTPDPDCSSC